jgi:predicted aminopeptidase
MVRKSLIRTAMAALAVVVLATGLGGCYYLQAARGQLEIVRKRTPIAEVMEDPATPPALRRRLELVRSAREFGVAELGLPDNGSYRSYADLGRDFVVWNVFAAPEFSLEPKRWCFPVAGCVAYRGYFHREAAEAEAARLAADGYDTHVAGVAAYSTLGRFEDPVLNTMMGWSDLRLVETLFHELAHQRLYVQDDTEFNESFATVAGRVGVRRWLQRRGDAEGLAALERRVAWLRDWMAEVEALRSRLAALYASGRSPAEMRAEKGRLFDELARSSIAPRQVPNDNAALVPAMAYHGLVPGFTGMLEACDGELDCFYDRAAAMAELEPATRRERLASYR